MRCLPAGRSDGCGRDKRISWPQTLRILSHPQMGLMLYSVRLPEAHSMRLRSSRVFPILTVLALLASSCVARVVRVEVLSRTDIQDGKPFGRAGAYERVTGRVYFAVDPTNVHNRQIVDLDKAGRNAAGEVEFSADVYLLKPKDMSKGNGAVLFEVSNRGGKGILRIVNGVNAADPSLEYGDG